MPFGVNMPRTRTWTDEQLKKAVATSKSFAQVLEALNLQTTGGNYKHIQQCIKLLGLDNSHFTGQGYRRGGNYPGSGFQPRPLDEILIKGSNYQSTSSLKKRLLKENLLVNCCSICSQVPSWQGEPLVMVLDHINGDNTDNRLRNLRLLCPNCNSQQPTFCRKRSTISWPDDDTLLKLVEDNGSCTPIAKILNAKPGTVRNRVWNIKYRRRDSNSHARKEQ